MHIAKLKFAGTFFGAGSAYIIHDEGDSTKSKIWLYTAYFNAVLDEPISASCTGITLLPRLYKHTYASLCNHITSIVFCFFV